jgi:multiple sugar transport system permease protein/putative chitobiose transport system permease protein
MTAAPQVLPATDVAVATKARRPRPSFSPTTVVLTAVAVLIAAAFVLPAVWILVGSFRPNLEILTTMSPLSWRLIVPSELTLDNYSRLLLDSGFARSLLNSAIVCLASVLVGLLISSMAAYALAVFHFPGRNLVFAVIVVSFMVPFEAIAIPLAQQFTTWGLGNTLVGLVLPGIGNGLAVFNLRQYFLGIPSSYREAAMLDGASEPRILFALYLRISGPALTNSAVLIFLGQWTAFLWPLLIISDNRLQLAPVALAGTFGEHAADYGQNFAGTVLLALVPAISMLVLQRFFGRLAIASGEK